MGIARRTVLAVLLLCSSACSVHRDAGPALTRIAFGSCCYHDHPQPIWDAIVAADPDLWIWTGDIVYADTRDEGVMRAKYDAQKARHEYRRLLATCPVIGTWDDHDYGVRNGGREFPAREMSQRAMLDFLDEPADSPRREQEGVYATYVYGPPESRVKVILLDTRYHREQPGPDADILGEAQWRRLEREFDNDAARLTLLISSIQFVADEHPFEKWNNFPAARSRMLDLIARTGVTGLIIISGDRHIAEICRLTDPRLDYPLYDITASGLTHSWEDCPDVPGASRVGDMYTGLNFGLIRIDWESDPVRLTIEIRDVEGAVRITETVSLVELMANGVR